MGCAKSIEEDTELQHVNIHFTKKICNAEQSYESDKIQHISPIHRHIRRLSPATEGKMIKAQDLIRRRNSFMRRNDKIIKELEKICEPKIF